MQEGLLWYDKNPNRLLVEKVRQAAARYEVRLHKKPTVCYVNDEQYDGDPESVSGIVIKPAANIRPNYLWIGVENDSGLARAA